MNRFRLLWGVCGLVPIEKNFHRLTMVMIPPEGPNPPCDVSALALENLGSQASPRGGAEADFEAHCPLLDL